MISLDYKVETGGTLKTSIPEVARLLDHNVAVGVNTVMVPAHKIAVEPIPSGPSGVKKAIKLERAKISTAVASIETNHPLMEVVEDPTKPHDILPRGSVSDMVAGTAHKALKFKYNGKFIIRRKVHHPGTKGKKSFAKADAFVEKNIGMQLKLAVDATLAGKRLAPIDAGILAALQSLL